MTYKVFCDGQPLHDPDNSHAALLSPVVTLEDSVAGSFEFSMSPTHPLYNSVIKYQSVVTVTQNDDVIFTGRAVQEITDFYNRKKIYCEGELNYLVDSVQRQATYADTEVRAFLARLIDVHNAQVDDNKAFNVGIVTVTDNTPTRYTDYEGTLECIRRQLIDVLGGHLRVRNINGARYLDYLRDYPETNTQVIRFGSNLLDFSRTMDASDIATAIIPLGTSLETDAQDGNPAMPVPNAPQPRVTVESVNGGSDFIYSAEAVEEYGYIYKTVVWDDITSPAELLAKGIAYLRDIQYDTMVIECRALDLNISDTEISRIKLLDRVRVLSAPHGLDRYFPVTRLSIRLDAPEQNMITLGVATYGSLTATTASANADIMKRIDAAEEHTSTAMQAAIDNATQMINDATHGHVVTTGNEQLIMDTDNTETATKVWRWNIGGLGYSSNGYKGPFETAITMDGTIVGEFIVAGSVTADKISADYKAEVATQINVVDGKLGDYYTKLQTESQIQNSSNSVLIAARAETRDYTDGKLLDYYTQAQIDVKTDQILSTVETDINTALGDFYSKSEVDQKADSITATVATKVDSATLSTTLRQSAEDIRIAWNNISNNIQLENGELRFYNGTELNMTANVGKLEFKSEGRDVGEMAVRWSGNEVGMTLNALSGAAFMIFAYNDKSYMRYIKATDSLFFHSGVEMAASARFHGNTYFSSDVDMSGAYICNAKFKNSATFEQGAAVNGTLYLPSGGSIANSATFTSKQYFTAANGINTNGITIHDAKLSCSAQAVFGGTAIFNGRVSFNADLNLYNHAIQNASFRNPATFHDAVTFAGAATFNAVTHFYADIDMHDTYICNAKFKTATTFDNSIYLPSGGSIYNGAMFKSKQYFSASNGIDTNGITVHGTDLTCSSYAKFGAGSDFRGTANFYNGIDMHGSAIYAESDKRLKSNIKPVRTAHVLDMVSALTVCAFDWRDSNRHEPAGLVAQQVRNVAPELVDTGMDGYLRIKADKLVYYLIGAVQALTDKVKKLEGVT